MLFLIVIAIFIYGLYLGSQDKEPIEQHEKDW